MATICPRCNQTVSDIGAMHYCPNLPRDSSGVASRLDTTFIWKPLVERLVVALERIADKLSQP